MSFLRSPIIRWLLNHSYGQGGTVAVPMAPESIANSMPHGEFPPGITDVLDHLTQRYKNVDNQVDWCFLVGGPGNGKSEALKELTKRVGITLPARVPGQPVPRTVPQNWPSTAHVLASGLELVLINDASIPRSDASNSNTPGSLFKDLTDAFRRVSGPGSPIAVFANVNRGILVEEANSLAGLDLIESNELLASSIIRSIALGRTDIPTIEVVVPQTPNAPQYAQLKVIVQGAETRTVIAHVVFLDVLSLLEPAPGGGGAVIDFASRPPVVAPYLTSGKLISGDLPRDTTTAGKFLSSFGTSTYWEDGGCKDPTGALCDAHSTCPFAQNSRWIQTESLRARLLDTLRAAEIAAGRRLTYRDLLGHISLAILGEPEDSWLAGEHPCEWAAKANLGIRDGIKGAAVDVAYHRIYATLFSVSAMVKNARFEKELGDDNIYRAIKNRVTSKGQPPRPQAFERAFVDIDPAADTDAWQGTRGRVLDAVESLDVISPSEQARLWPEINSVAISDIEIVLDQAIRDEITSELKRSFRSSNNRVRFLRNWRSKLMLRQVGLALGHLTHGSAIQSWLAEQENALRGGSRLPLGDGIHNLIMPTREANRIYIAPLRPRTYCLVENLPPNTLLSPISVNDLDVVIAPQGDTIGGRGSGAIATTRRTESSCLSCNRFSSSPGSRFTFRQQFSFIH